jgi:tRNA pseudouridine38-40 synthase
MINIRLVIEYVGTRYHGWQRQPKLPTLQGVLEDCITQISGERIKLIGAGRTDAGVHALGQVANFKTKSTLKTQTWKRALNALLPEDIVILKTETASETFHARKSARSKVYQYRILNRQTPSAIVAPFTWHVPVPLSLKWMRAAAIPLQGRHDFTSFCGKASSAKCTTAHLLRLSIERQKDSVLITLTGTNFLQYMVRNIVGTLVKAGLGKLSPERILAILKAKDRKQAGPTAPPWGLFLIRVNY